MRVLVTGAQGFIGRQIVARLLAAEHHVLQAVRTVPAECNGARYVLCDFACDVNVESWKPRLAGVDAVVNCAGILRESGGSTFQRVHVEAPAALFDACVQCGVHRVIQISALGHPDVGEFIASKHRGDEYLASLNFDWTILRPSVVYSPRGSYGGTSLLRAMSALPGALLLPGNGQQLIEPVCGDDLAALVAHLLDTGAATRRVVEVGGPEVLTLENYLRSWRAWLRLARSITIRVPTPVIAFAAWMGEHLSSGPLGMTMYRMLKQDNTLHPDSRDFLHSLSGWTAESIGTKLANNPSFVQDRWQASLYVILPLLRVCLGVLWIGSAVAGFMTPQPLIRSVLHSAGVTSGSVGLVYGASAVDLVLGTFMLLGKYLTLVGTLMLVSVFAYTVFIGVKLPQMWLEPFGALIKNLVLIPAVLVVMGTAEKS